MTGASRDHKQTGFRERVATAVAMVAMIRLLPVASASSALENAAWYQRREKPSHTVNFEELKLKTARISNGK